MTRQRTTAARSRCRRVLVTAAVVAGAVALPAARAGAVVSGPCQGYIKGLDVAPLSASDPDDAIEVDEYEEIEVGATSAEPIDAYEVQLEFAGIRWTVAQDETASGETSWNKTVNVGDYSRYGVGLYKVHGVSQGAAPCDGAALVKVGGSPLGKPAALAGLALAGLGAAAIGGGAVRVAGEGRAPAKLVRQYVEASTPDEALEMGKRVTTPAEYADWVTSCVDRALPQGLSPGDLLDDLCDRGRPHYEWVCTKGLKGVTW